MGTYSNRNRMIPEASTGASLPHFAWFYPGSFYSAPKTNSIPPQGYQVYEPVLLPSPPISSVAPTAKPAMNNNSGTKPTKAGKQKSSAKGSNQVSSKTFKLKQTKKNSKKKGQSMPEAKRERRNLEVDIGRMNFDLSGVPSPFCSCTDMPRVCYKWGAGGWQSSCCTINISEYPLPMSATRPGARVAGRKMSNGAYMKLLLKLAAEGHDLSHPVDLKDHWARHGTNKFVTIK